MIFFNFCASGLWMSEARVSIWAGTEGPYKISAKQVDFTPTLRVFGPLTHLMMRSHFSDYFEWIELFQNNLLNSASTLHV